jgi:sulfite oxidase
MALSLRQLREEFPRVEVTATLMCAGNRRARMDAMRRIAAVPQWSAGAIGNARWAGVPLRAVLERAGLRARSRHVHFSGCDRVDRGDVITRFAGSIPMGLARQRDPAPVILAYEMNGAPLTRAHGFPLRAVVPGAIGARSVKWLDTIAVEPAPSDNPHFIKGHRLPRAGVPKPIFAFPPTGGIFADAALASDAAEVRGYAVVGGRDRIARVEISVDGGKKWRPARLVGPDRPGCWRLWRADVDLSGTGAIIARATTRFGRRMPRQARWNAHGYLYDAWPRVEVQR